MKRNLNFQGNGIAATGSPLTGPSETSRRGCHLNWASPRVRLLLHLLLIAAAAILLNLYSHTIGVYVSLSDPRGFVPLLAPGLAWNLTWLNAWCSLAFIVTALRLFYAKEPPALSLARALFRAFTIVVLYRLIVGGPVLLVDPLWLKVQRAVSHDAALAVETLFVLLNGLFKLMMVAALLLMARRLYRSMRPLFAVHIAQEWHFSDERQPDDKRRS